MRAAPGHTLHSPAQPCRAPFSTQFITSQTATPYGTLRRHCPVAPYGPSFAARPANCILQSLSSCKEGTLRCPWHHYSFLQTALPWHALLTAHSPQHPANRSLLSRPDSTLPRHADCIPLSSRRWGGCYTLNSSAGPFRRPQPSAPCEQHAVVASCGLNAIQCLANSTPLPCLTTGRCCALCSSAARCGLHFPATTLPATTPALPGLIYFVGHLLHESASYPGCHEHGLTAPPPVPPCDSGVCWAPSSSHSAQTLMHQCNSYTPIVPRVTTNSICASLQLTTLLQPASPTPANATHASRPCPADSTLSCSALQTEPCRRLPLAMLCATHALALPASLPPVPVPGLT